MKRKTYGKHRAQYIARSKRRKDLETAAMQFLRDKGLLPKGTGDTSQIRRAAALEFVRWAGLLDEGSTLQLGQTRDRPRAPGFDSAAVDIETGSNRSP
jgi:hypothetical protein